MKLLEKTDDEILEIANPIWDNLVKSSNVKDYSGFTKDFSAQMLYGANEVEIGKQWANNKLLTSLSKQKYFLGCLKRNSFVTVLFKQKIYYGMSSTPLNDPPRYNPSSYTGTTTDRQRRRFEAEELYLSQKLRTF